MSVEKSLLDGEGEEFTLLGGRNAAEEVFPGGDGRLPGVRGAARARRRGPRSQRRSC